MACGIDRRGRSRRTFQKGRLFSKIHGIAGNGRLPDKSPGIRVFDEFPKIIVFWTYGWPPYLLIFLELSPEEQAKRDKRLLKKEELSREHDKILAEIENHDKNSVNLALKK